MENELKIGDVVTLNSDDNVKMTINNFEDNMADCVWFDGNKCLHKGYFSIGTLKLVQ